MSSSITLVSSDGIQFSVARDVITVSKFVSAKAATTATVPVDVSSAVLKNVIDWAKHHHPPAKTDASTPANDDMCATDNISGWDLQFMKIVSSSTEALFLLTIAAEKLEIAALETLACKTIANIIKSRAPAEAIEAFKIPAGSVFASASAAAAASNPPAVASSSSSSSAVAP